MSQPHNKTLQHGQTFALGTCLGVIQSMNREGEMNDNAEMESFLHQFKAERMHKNEYVTEMELRAVVIEYVGFYYKRRLHSLLNYMTPDEYEVSLG